MSSPGRFSYEPMLNLATGRPVGVEIHRMLSGDRVDEIARSTVWNARQLAEFDAGVAVTSVLHTADHYDATTPLHIDALAETVVAARGRLARLREHLRGRDPQRAIPPLVLEVNPPVLAAVGRRSLADGVAELRSAGFDIALDGVGSGFGVDQVAVLAPDIVKIEPDLVARLPRDRRAAISVRAIVEVCAEIGTRVSAVGVTTPEELLAVRDAGIDRAQGPLLGEPRWQASTIGVLLPVELMSRTAAGSGRAAAVGPAPAARPPAARTPVFTLGGPAVSLPDGVTAEAVRQALADHPQAGSVVLLDRDGRPSGFVDRNRFMIAISGPFGRALYANRPASTLADPPRTVGLDADVRSTLARCLSGDRDRSYDDIVLVDAGGLCTGVVRVSDLLQEATGAPAA